MMSFVNTNLSSIVYKQYLYKLSVSSRLLTALVLVQLLALFFSLLDGTGSFGGSGGILDYNIRYYTADAVIMLTSIWAIVTAIILSNETSRSEGFLFVTNRLSVNISNILVCCTLLLIASFASVMSRFLLIVIIYITADFSSSMIRGFGNLSSELLIGFCAVFLTFLLIAAIAYFLGMLIQWNRLFIILIPAVLAGAVFLSIKNDGNDFILAIFEFYNEETSLWLFSIKTVGTAIVCFVMSVLISNRMEVK